MAWLASRWLGGLVLYLSANRIFALPRRWHTRRALAASSVGRADRQAASAAASGTLPLSEA